MTLWPAESKVRYRSFEGKPIPRNPLCEAPGCKNWSKDAHHIFPASQLPGGRSDWVLDTQGTGAVIQNIAWLCRRCHDLVTENKVRLWIFAPGSGFAWQVREIRDKGVFYRTIGPLNQAPASQAWRLVEGSEPQAGSLGGEMPPSGPDFGDGHGVRGEPGTAVPAPELASTGDAPARETPAAINPGETCPICNRRKPHERKPSSPKETKQLNLGEAPADFVDEVKARIDDVAEAWGIKSLPHHRFKVVDLALEFSQAVTSEAAQGIAKERPWAT